MKKALITGVTGQDGSYLTELLLEKGYKVHGLARPLGPEVSKTNYPNINHLFPKKNFILHHGDLMDYPTIQRLFQEIKPDEVYHLAGQKQSQKFEDDFGSFALNINVTQFFLSAIKNLKPRCRFYLAGSSEMFGRALISPQDESTLFNPVSPYAISKVAAFHLIKTYREFYNIFACTGILYNHESPRRDFKFVSRKITSTAAKIKLGLEKELRLGDLDAKRDWGFAGDYVEAMWMMLQSEKADDYVIGTGETHTVREFVEIVFDYLGLNWRKFVVIDKKFLRQPEIAEIRANPAKIKKALNWAPKVKFSNLVRMMVDADLKLLKNK
jgi:GDPmannose 4,6-dehydratase